VHLIDVHLIGAYLMSVYLINVYLTGVYPMSVYLTGVHLKQACSPHRACISEFQILKILEFLVFGKTSLYPTVIFRGTHLEFTAEAAVKSLTETISSFPALSSGCHRTG
jgi:hypothetical protein